eukprot:3372097-Pyramimonas_sp.AAC.1
MSVPAHPHTLRAPIGSSSDVPVAVFAWLHVQFRGPRGTSTEGPSGTVPMVTSAFWGTLGSLGGHLGGARSKEGGPTLESPPGCPNGPNTHG